MSKTRQRPPKGKNQESKKKTRLGGGLGESKRISLENICLISQVKGKLGRVEKLGKEKWKLDGDLGWA